MECEECRRLGAELEHLKRDHAEKLDLLTKNRMESIRDYRQFHTSEQEARQLVKIIQRQLVDHKQSH